MDPRYICFEQLRKVPTTAVYGPAGEDSGGEAAGKPVGLCSRQKAGWIPVFIKVILYGAVGFETPPYRTDIFFKKVLA
jgi:hypothetical protein